MLFVEISITMCEFEIFHPWIVFHKPYMVLQISMLSLVIKFSNNLEDT